MDKYVIADGWQMVALTELCEIIVSNVDKKISKYEIPVLMCNYMDVYSNNYLDRSTQFLGGTVTKEELIRFKLIKDDVIITKDSETPDDIAIPSVVVNDISDLVCGYHLAILRPKKSKVSGQFLHKALYTLLCRKHFGKMASGATRYGLSLGAIYSCPVLVPSFSEQKAIANILITLDEVIEKTNQLIAKYERIKTGLMQDLLTRGIDLHGNIRNEETHKFNSKSVGKVPFEWNVIKLGNQEYFTLSTGGTPSTDRESFWLNGTIPWMSSGEVHQKFIYHTQKYITELGYKHSNARYYPVNSIVIALAGQGKTRGTVALNKIELTSNQSIAAIIPNQKLIDPDFIFYYLESRYQELRGISAGGGRAGLSLSILSNVDIPLPSKEEQQKISSILLNIEKSLYQFRNENHKFNQLKSGLMQDLLTGKVRVNALMKQTSELI